MPAKRLGVVRSRTSQTSRFLLAVPVPGIAIAIFPAHGCDAATRSDDPSRCDLSMGTGTGSAVSVSVVASLWSGC